MPSTLTSCEANLKQSIVLDKMIKIQAIDKICLCPIANKPPVCQVNEAGFADRVGTR